MSLRTDKVAAQIQEIAADALSQHRARADELITVTRVQVAPDLRQAWVYLSFFSPKQAKPTDTQTQLEKLTPLLQAEVADRLRSKFTPRLQLRLDESITYADEINRKLKQL